MLRDITGLNTGKVGEYRIRIVGVGGQGVISAGVILAISLASEGYNVSQTQSYGAEVSGTPNVADVVFSKSEILFPYIEEADILISLHKLGYERYGAILRKGGILIYDPHISPLHPPEGVTAYNVPAAKISEKCIGSSRGLNLVMLGSLSRILGCPTVDSLVEAAHNTIGGGDFKKLILEGYRFIDEGT